MKRHELKTDPAVFAAVLAGVKTHEIRFDDRGFAIGDQLELRETVHSGADMKANPGLALVYTGRTAVRTISHIQTGYGLAAGWCILSFSRDQAEQLASLILEDPAGGRMVISSMLEHNDADDTMSFYTTNPDTLAKAKVTIKIELDPVIAPATVDPICTTCYGAVHVHTLAGEYQGECPWCTPAPAPRQIPAQLVELFDESEGGHHD